MTGPTPLVFDLNRHRRTPLHRQLYDQFREAILSGRLEPGERVPSTRSLSEELAVSRTTVLTAVRRLMVEGFLEARVGAGTRVSESLRSELIGRGERRKKEALVGPRPTSIRSGRLLELSEDVPSFDGPARPFQVGVPALERVPTARWARLAGRQWRAAEGEDLGYAGPRGELFLRDAIADYVGLSRGVSATAEQILITSGSQEGLALVAHALVDPGDFTWLEDPGYGGAHGAFVAAGASVVPVPVDEMGLDVAQGRRSAEEACLAYVTPSHQFPLGVAMDLGRRLALLSWAEQAGSWIVEDDYDSEYRYEGRPFLSLQGLDEAGRVIYVGTFSKTLFPGLRLGFLVLPEDLVETVTAMRYYLSPRPPIPHQRALADFITEGDLARHVRRIRDVYRSRRDALLEALDRHFAGQMRVVSSETGLHLTSVFAEEVDDRAVETEAHRLGLGALALSPFYLGDDPTSGLVLGFGATPVDEVEAATIELARAIEAGGRRASDRASPDRSGG